MLSFALDVVPGLQGATIVAEFPAGLAHHSWRLHSDIGDVVVRIDTSAAKALKLERRFESDLLRQIVSSGLAPELLWVDLERGIQVTQYLPGSVWTSRDLADTENLVRLAKIMAQLHGIPLAGLWSDRFATLRNYAALSGSKAAGQLLAEALVLSSELELASRCGLVLCHGDVHIGNIVDDGKLRLIDWEYAGVTHRALELAAFARQQEFTEVQISVVLDAYEAEVGELGKDEFNLACGIYDRTVLLWLSAIYAVLPKVAARLTVPERYKHDLAKLAG